MAKLVLRKCDSLINCLSLFLIVGSGMIIHTLTSLTIHSYYGDPWGFVAFLLPGFAECYLLVIQLGDNMYNYSLLIGLFAVTSILTGLVLFCKNLVVAKVENLIEKRNASW